MKILYIPLDERPCNYSYVDMISKIAGDSIEFIMPTKNILGDKKKPGDTEKIWKFILNNINDCNYVIINIETVVYGGLLPSRLHYMTLFECMEKINRIKKLKEINPNVKIYISSLIMRTPRYNSSDEEPDYYEQYGSNIFKQGYYKDKKLRVGLSDDEQKELDESFKVVPEQYIKDYEERRIVNTKVNKAVIDLVKSGYIDFMSIPQDDAAEFGYTAIDQKIVIGSIIENRLQHKIISYPGADEVGCTLTARAFNDYFKTKTKFYVMYSSTLGHQIIPNYEDRPMNESLKSHILAVNGQIVDNSDNADIILAINSPGKFMQEADQQNEKDITYTSFRNLRAFVAEINRYVVNGKKVVICDSAFSNGGDIELVRMLDDIKILDKIYGYAGWNTNCNTLGTALATAVMSCKSYDRQTVIHNLIFRIMEDLIYQSIVRHKIIDEILPQLNVNNENFREKEGNILKKIKEELMQSWDTEIRNSFKQYQIGIKDVFLPWHRIFEIGLNISCEINLKTLK